MIGVNRTVQFVLSPILVVFESTLNAFYTSINIKITMFYSGNHKDMVINIIKLKEKGSPYDCDNNDRNDQSLSSSEGNHYTTVTTDC